jgi:hypothetical protein
MLLRAPVSFAAADDNSFEVTDSDCGETITARVFLDNGALPANFSTTDRHADLRGALVQAEWTTPIDAGGATDTGSCSPVARLSGNSGRSPGIPGMSPVPGAFRYNLSPGDISWTPPRTREVNAPDVPATHLPRGNHHRRRTGDLLVAATDGAYRPRRSAYPTQGRPPSRRRRISQVVGLATKPSQRNWFSDPCSRPFSVRASCRFDP